ncbi:cysteine hydrolase [Halobacillus litoralis]|uniref:cysteine hydrolase family protein n=1 Tax=Halobacillus litoralis TaxID=45668 RepID=UPI001CD5565F|nr:cysteine hydrolase family protein [Halobacillus litoralis]MCA0970701.1 cysteine hydrolase [Halobacillus litoralis]
MKKALMIVDVQNYMFQEAVHNGEQLLENLKSLITRARSTNTPIFYIQHNAPAGAPLERGTENWEIHADIAPTDQDTIIEKHTPDAFFETPLDDELKKQGVEHIILTGIQTEICVDTTCRRAFSMDYKVTLAVDTHGTWDSHNLTAKQIIQHHNDALRWFADTVLAEEIAF